MLRNFLGRLALGFGSSSPLGELLEIPRMELTDLDHLNLLGSNRHSLDSEEYPGKIKIRERKSNKDIYIFQGG